MLVRSCSSNNKSVFLSISAKSEDFRFSIWTKTLEQDPVFLEFLGALSSACIFRQFISVKVLCENGTLVIKTISSSCLGSLIAEEIHWCLNKYQCINFLQKKLCKVQQKGHLHFVRICQGFYYGGTDHKFHDKRENAGRSLVCWICLLLPRNLNKEVLVGSAPIYNILFHWKDGTCMC